jgi:dTDP-4-amino-4,6-dideoxygalactose transaminase
MRELKSLALFGGVPRFPKPLFVGCPNRPPRAKLFARWRAMLERNWLTNDGPLVKEFEDRICRIVGAKHCMATCNATIGLEIAAKALELKGEVIVPSFTFVATAHSLQWLGISPVFCDIDPRTHNLDPDKVEALITPRTTGILGVHVWGRPCAVEPLSRIAAAHRLTLMFDAAHGFGCSSQGRMIGSFGAAEVFSFHATKFINAFEGGAIVTNDDRLAHKIRLMRNFGFVGYDRVASIGTNGKMSEASAAMGVSSLESLDDIVARNRSNYEQYCKSIDAIRGLEIVRYDERERNNFQYIVIEVSENEFGLSRDELCEFLHLENVMARRYFFPGCHQMEPYRSADDARAPDLPATLSLTERVMSLPTGLAVREGAIRKIAELIAAASKYRTDIRTRLAERRL